MKKKELLKIIMEGVETWNSWRSENPHPYPDLRDADLSEANLGEARLTMLTSTGRISKGLKVEIKKPPCDGRL